MMRTLTQERPFTPGFSHLGAVEVDDCLHAHDVQPACGHVSADEIVRFLLTKCLERL